MTDCVDQSVAFCEVYLNYGLLKMDGSKTNVQVSCCCSWICHVCIEGNFAYFHNRS